MLNERLDRQLRIEGWNQDALENSSVAVVGDEPILTSLFLLACSALGLNKLTVIAPSLDSRILDMATSINEDIDLTYLEGFLVHPAISSFFSNCRAIVDLTTYGLANKLSINKAYTDNLAVIRGCVDIHDDEGFKTFTYFRGREWQELKKVVSAKQLPVRTKYDPVLSIILSGIVLEELTKYLMGHDTSEELITYRRKKLRDILPEENICVVGAGALGNFVALGLALTGFKNITFMDPDIIELTNLNRQVFFYDAVGKNKAEILSTRLREIFNINTDYNVCYFDAETDISSFDIIFDCVDNFETRIILSEKCKENQKILISGGSSANAGQVVIYDPRFSRKSPAKVLGLYEIVDKRQVGNYKRSRESCVYQPEPSVVTTNQIIGGFMVDSCRILLSGEKPENIFYASDSPEKF